MITLEPIPIDFAIEYFPITCNHAIEESLNFRELEHVGIEKVEQLFRDMLRIKRDRG